MKKGVISALLIFGMVLFTACSDGSGTAATVDGEKIKEKDVTARIEAMRELSPDYSTKKGWEAALKQASLTPETLRKQIIENMARNILIGKAAEKEGLKANEKAIDEQIASIKKNSGKDKDGWKRLLASYGVSDEDGLRQVLKEQDLNNQLREKIAGTKTPSEEEINDYIKKNAANFAGRESAQILLTAEDGTEDAQMKLAGKILAELKKGADFGALAKKYSRDTASVKQDGMVGWSSLASVKPPQQYTDALSKLKKGELSSPVKSDLGVHIIKCLDIFEPKGEVKPGDIPKQIDEALKKQAVQASGQAVYQEYVNKLYSDAKIEIHTMPKNVSYGI